jgi:hypothetical protein
VISHRVLHRNIAHVADLAEEPLLRAHGRLTVA